METKICGVCKKEKKLDDFWIRSDNGKHRNTCKECQRKQSLNRKEIGSFPAGGKDKARDVALNGGPDGMSKQSIQKK